MRKKSAEILESWREKAAEESKYEFWPQRYLTGLPEAELEKLANPYRVIVLEG